MCEEIMANGDWVTAHSHHHLFVVIRVDICSLRGKPNPHVRPTRVNGGKPRVTAGIGLLL